MPSSATSFSFDPRSVTEEQRAAIVEWAIRDISGLDAVSRVARCGELAEQIGWVSPDAGKVLDTWCREGKTMDQARVEDAEKHLAELDAVECGAVGGVMESLIESGVSGQESEVSGADKGMELACELLREMMGVVDPKLVEAKWGWNWEKSHSMALAAGECAVNAPVGPGKAMGQDGVVVEWKFGAVLIRRTEDGRTEGEIVRVLAEARMRRVRYDGGAGRVIFSIWEPMKVKMVKKPGKLGRPKEKSVRVDVESVGLKFLAVCRKWMPGAVDGASQADLARKLMVSRQNIFFHEKAVEKRIVEAGERNRGRRLGAE